MEPAAREALLAKARAGKVEWFPASSGQRRLWFLDRLRPGSSAFNLPATVRLSGPLDRAALAAGLGEVVRRHEPLRTAFAAVDGEPVQIVRPARPVQSPWVDLAALRGEEGERLARGLVAAEILRPFDLASGTLLRALVLRLAPEEHVLALTLHHIASDEWSRGLLVRELAGLYDGLAAGRPVALAPLPIRYVDYAVWQRRWLEGEECASALAYWRERLAGELPVLELPADRPRPHEATYRGGRESLLLRGAARSAQNLAGATNATPFILLLASFKVLLSRLTRQHDLVVGVPVANRNRMELEPLIGFFVNSLVCRTDLNGDPSFREALDRVREVALGAFEHQELPFERLVEEIRPERHLSRHPLFQVSFVMENEGARADRDESTSLRLSSFGGSSENAKFDLSLFARTDGADLLVTAEFSSDLFDRPTVTRLLRSYGALLEDSARCPECRLSELSLLAEEERHQTLIEWNDTRRAGPPLPTLHEVVAGRAARDPEALAVVQGEERWTYGRLEGAARRWVRALRGAGVVPGSFVAILVERRPEMVAALLAVMKTGAAYVPLSPAYPAERIAWMLKDSGASAVLSHPPLDERIGSSPVPRISIASEPEPSDLGAPEPDAAVGPEDFVYSIYTSGSSGRPKGVLVTHGALSNYLAWSVERYGVREGGPGSPVHSSLGFDLTVTSLLTPLWAGGFVVLAPESEGVDGLIGLLSGEAAAGLCKLTPSHLELLTAGLVQGRFEANVEALVIGGEALAREALEPWRRLAPGTRLWNEYGPTEATVGCSVHEARPDEPPRPLVPIGRPIASTRLYVADPGLHCLPIGVPGELWIGGAGLACGYLGRPELTAERFVPDPFGAEAGGRLYRTGDRARRLPEGSLDYLGRFDDQVKIRGYRIEPGEVEAVLSRHPALRDAAVVVRRAAEGPELVAFGVPNGAAERVDPVGLRAFLADQLPDYMVPADIALLRELPLTAHGKVDREALAGLALEPMAPAEDLRQGQPQSLLQAQILDIWSEIFSGRPIGIADSFFELGGHSILVVRMLARVRRRFGCLIQPAAFFPDPTVEHLARLVRNEVPKATSPLVEIQGGSGRPPLYLIHPSGGGVMCYLPLSRRLGKEQPVFGLQADAEQSFATFESLAAHYAAALLSHRSEGPFVLAGWSLGGGIAFEMACCLAGQGRPPDALVLLDTVAPDPERPPDVALLEAVTLDRPLEFLQALEKALGIELPVHAEELAALPVEAQLRLILEAARSRHVLPEEVELQDVALGLEAFRRLMALRRSWVPRTYSGSVVLVRSSEVEAWVPAEARRLRLADPTLGWSRYSTQTIEVRELPGTHHSLMNEPQVAAVAALLQAIVDAPAIQERN